jgi:hypothetical protein
MQPQTLRDNYKPGNKNVEDTIFINNNIIIITTQLVMHNYVNRRELSDQSQARI